MNLHIKTGLGIKNYVLDPNSNVEYEIFLNDFSWQIWAKNTKLNFSSESVKTKEHKESNSCEKYYFLIDAFLQNQFLTNFEEVIAKNRFSSFSTFWNNCPYWISNIESFPAFLQKNQRFWSFLMEHICFVAIRFSSVYEKRLEEKV